MMSVLEYAVDINKDVKEVLRMCSKLSINALKEDDILDDEAIILLDNEFSSDSEENYDELVEEYDELIEDIKHEEVKKIKTKTVKKEVSNNDTNDFNQKKKEMYKNKEKFKNPSNVLNNIILYKENMTVSELASALNVNVSDVIKKLFALGIMMNINSSLDFDTCSIIVSDYQKELKKEETRDETNFEEFEIVDLEKDLLERPPVVTIMGHVDHGKTTLLDAIRKTNVAEGEAGGITQNITAYQITCKDKKITFIDTPGHAAFTEMRARGASITDIIIIIVAADDGVMPQTIEVIDHAKAAGVPIIVAINKIDKPGANPEKVMTEMANNGITPDTWGGDYMFVPISAKNNIGIDDLLERILLIAEIQNLKANPNRYANGTVIESKIDKTTGVATTVLIQNGTLRIGDNVVVGNSYGKVRTLKNDLNNNLVEAGPSTPVTITGLNESPSAGDKFFVFDNEKKAKLIAEQRKNNAINKNNDNVKKNISLDDLFASINEGIKEINIVLKADVKGSEEAVKNSLLKINVEGVQINVIRSGIGAISESDIVLASASNAIIIGFNVRPDNKTLEFAKERDVDIRLYNIIYKLVEEIESAMKGILDPIYEEKKLGQAEVRQLFKFSKIGTIAGCYVIDGFVKRGAKARIIRDSVQIYDGIINSIQREKNSVSEVKQGIECGITIENFNDIKEKDIIEAYEIVEIK